MAAFPATALLPKQYVDVKTFESYPNGSTTTQRLVSILHAVDEHSSVKRTKSSPKNLPESFVIRTIYPGIHTSFVRQAVSTVMYDSYARANTLQVPIPSDWLWSDSSSQGPATFDTVAAKLFEKTMSKLKQDQANLSVDLAEARETVKLLRDLTNVKRAAERLKRELSLKTAKRSKRKYVIVYDNNGNPTKQRRYFDEPGSPGTSGPQAAAKYAAYARDQWMQARFGIRPLIGSIFDTMKAMLNQRITGKYRTTVTSKVAVQVVKSVGAGTGLDPKCTYLVDRETKGILISEWNFPANQPAIQDFFSLNPVGIAWELVPLSWMADYFVNVGQTLQNWEDWFRYASSFTGGMRTITTREFRTVTVNGSTVNPITYWPNGNPMDGTYVRSFSGNAICRVVRKNREVLSSLPGPGALTTKCNLSAAKVADVCSVISQILGSVRR